MWVTRGDPYDAEVVAGFEAVADVAWFLIVAGPFLTIAMAADAGELDNCVVAHFDRLKAARAIFLAGGDRSIFWEWFELERVKERKKNWDKMPRMAQLYMLVIMTLYEENSSVFHSQLKWVVVVLMDE
jgi:hypothetical protein